MSRTWNPSTGESYPEYVTDENDQFTTKEYVCDTDWTIREITPSEGYLLDKTIHEVGADPVSYTHLDVYKRQVGTYS